mgnify:CR=1 FL=1|tara:strand:- start:4463 stop:5221 length:759 start_codon:yes stop_codon:yes gene_type:complete
MIIAEIGLNHMGDKNKVDMFCNVLGETDFDAVTVQVREAEFYENPKYCDMVLADHVYLKIANQIKSANKQKFGVALADIHKLGLFERADCDFYKILSKDFLNKNFVRHIFKNIQPDKQVIFSTGTSSHEDIQFFLSENGSELHRIGLIHTQLTNRAEEVNLKVIETLRKEHKVPISFGNHCDVLEVLYAAQSFNPEHSFVYIKGNDDCPYPDDLHAVPIAAAAALSEKIKMVRTSIGTGIKKRMKNEIEGQE